MVFFTNAPLHWGAITYEINDRYNDLIYFALEDPNLVTEQKKYILKILINTVSDTKS